MKKPKIFWIAAVVAVLVLAVLLFHKPPVKPSLQPKVASAVQPSNSEVHVTPSNSPINKSPVATAASNLSDLETKYRQGLISKGEVIFEAQKRQYLQPQNFYGKVIDQNGDPVVGVEITAGNEGLDTTGRVWPQTFRAQSDLDGLFEITGKIGTPIGVRLSKSGYLWGLRGEGYKAPAGGASSPADRVILTMWKLHGAEPLVGSGLDAKIAFDGSSTRFDIMTGKESADGDLQITLLRSPLGVRRGRDIFDWTVKIEILGGGILPENDPYPYWTPGNGYQSSFEFNMSSNNIPWSSSFQGNFYIKNARGQYGRMQANVYAALTPARIQFGFTINPSGSQNLEPSADK